ARRVGHTYAGINPKGDCGSWLDGGLRSGFPTYRALRMTRPRQLVNDRGQASQAKALRVLGISTGRLNSLPSKTPTMIHEVALNGIGQLSDQNFVMEPAITSQFAALRESMIAEVKAEMGLSPTTA